MIIVMNQINKVCTLAILAGMTLMIADISESASLYKWIDEEGVTQYSERPPPAGTKAETLNVNPGKADKSAIKQLESRINTVDELRDARLEEQEAKRQAEEERAMKQENCRRSRDRLASFQIPNALIAQPDGSRIRVDEETRLRELATSQEMIDKYCN